MFLQGPDSQVDEIVQKTKVYEEKQKDTPTDKAAQEKPNPPTDIVAVHTDKVTTENHREAGPVHVGHQMWQRLELDRILQEVDMTELARILTQVMTLNRLIAPSSEHTMPEWVERTALNDILEKDFSLLNDESLYRTMDKLYPARGRIEKELAKREENLFNLDTTIYLYHLTSTICITLPPLSVSPYLHLF